jgi:hypothetical protein
MIFSESSPEDGAIFLRKLKKYIQEETLASFSREDGFNDPNNFLFLRIESILKKNIFPDKDFGEYAWAIEECGIERIAAQDPWVRLFACSIQLFARKIVPGGIVPESEFLYLMAEGAVQNSESEYLSLILLFLEWLHEHVESVEEYEDYYLLLCWLLVKWLKKETKDENFSQVIKTLRGKNLSKEEIEILSGSSVMCDRWLTVTESIPDMDGVDRAIVWDLISPMS